MFLDGTITLAISSSLSTITNDSCLITCKKQEISIIYLGLYNTDNNVASGNFSKIEIWNVGSNRWMRRRKYLHGISCK